MERKDKQKQSDRKAKSAKGKVIGCEESAERMQSDSEEIAKQFQSESKALEKQLQSKKKSET